MTRAFAYCRISHVTGFSPGETIGVERQEHDCREIAARKGWTITEVYVDNDIPASKYSRKVREDYLALLRDIEAGEYDAGIIWMEDRLHRQVIELAEFLKACDAAGVTRLASAGGEFDLSDPDQRTMLFVKAAMAEAEIEKMRTRTRRKRLEMAQRGVENGGGKRPFGFVGAGKNKVTSQQAERERQYIREAARRILAGDSLRGILIDWQRRGIKTSEGKLWRNKHFRRMLLSSRIAGLREHHGQLYTATWEPVIPREQWEAIKAILEDPARKTNNVGGIPRYLLSGMVVCGVCGHRMRTVLRGDYRGYMCIKPPGGKCVQRSAKPVEDLITAALFEAVESDDFAKLLNVPDDDPTRELYESLAQDQGLLDRLEDKVAQELISVEAAKRNRATIEDRMERTRERLTRLQGNRIIAHIPRNLRSVWPDFSLDRRRAILAAVIERVEIHPTGPGRKTFDPDAIKVAWKA